MEDVQTVPKLGKRLSGDFDAQFDVKCVKVKGCPDAEGDLISSSSSVNDSGNKQLEVGISDCACIKDKSAIKQDTVGFNRQENVPMIGNNCDSNGQVFSDDVTNECVGDQLCSAEDMCDNSILKKPVENATRNVLSDICNDTVRNDTNVYSASETSTCSKEENNEICELPFWQNELDISICHRDKSCSKEKHTNYIPSCGFPWVPYRIWMRGSSIVFWAAKSAEYYQTGTHLGLDGWGVSVDWKGWRGMLWKNLIPWINKDFRKAVKIKRKPDMLVVHLGSNDVVSIETSHLIRSIKDDFSHLSNIFPDVTLVWSTMLPRLCWRGTENIEEAEKSRQEINAAVIDHVINIGGKVIKHMQLESADEDFFIWDGVHLSDYGNEIFLKAIQGGLELFTTSEEVVFPYASEEKPTSGNNVQ